MDTAFLQYYSNARTIAQTNTILRLLCSGYTDGLFHSQPITFEAKDSLTHEVTELNSADSCLDYIYTRSADAPIEISAITDHGRALITEPNQAWELLKPLVKARMGDAFSESNWHTSQYTMLYSLNSEALSIANQLEFKQRQEASLQGQDNVWTWLADKKLAGEDIQALLLQISSFNGNPNHPFAKLRRKIADNRELSQDEVIQYFAEFGNTVSVPVYALSKCYADTRHSMVNADYTTQFIQDYPHEYEAWATSLRKKDLNPEEFVPVPVHPLNEAHLTQELQEWIEKGNILKTEASIGMLPTISTRSLQPHSTTASSIKLTMPDIQLTGVARKLSPSAICTAGMVTDLTKAVVTQDKSLANHLRIVGEPSGVFFNPNKDTAYEDYNPDMLSQSSSLTALLRQNPQTLVGQDEIAIPLSGCFYSLGMDKRTGHMAKPFLLDMMRAAGVHDAASAKDYFRDYAHTVIQGEVGLFARYGIALEAHQQNSFDIFKRDGHLKARLVQDLADGVQIYQPIYGMHPERAAHIAASIKGLSPKNYAFNLTEKLDDPLRQVMHTTFKCHLFPVAAVTAKEFGLTKSELLEIMREEITTTLQQAKTELVPTISADKQEDYQAFLDKIEDGLLHKPMLAKAFLTTMVSDNLSGYMDKTVQANPFEKHALSIA